MTNAYDFKFIYQTHLNGDYEKALKLYIEKFTETNDHKYLFLIALCHWDLGKPHLAIKHLKSALKITQKNRIYWEFLRIFYSDIDDANIVKQIQISAKTFGHNLNPKVNSFKDYNTEKQLIDLYVNQHYIALTWLYDKKYITLNYSSIRNVLALSYQQLGLYKLVQTQYELGLKIDPRNPNLISNYGIFLKDIGEVSKAKKVLLGATKLPGVSSETLNALAICYQKTGDIKLAVHYFKKALDGKSMSDKAFINLMTLTTQLGDQSDVLPPKSLNSDDQLTYLILCAIRSTLRGDLMSLMRMLEEIKEAESFAPKIKNLTSHKFFHGYKVFLQQLHSELTPACSYNDTLFHIGESHCLSFSHETIKGLRSVFVIKPLITFGAKAYHFSVTGNNQFKAITAHNFTRMPTGSTALVSFGEIDCRANEGFIAAASKLGVKSCDLIPKTIDGYIEWFEPYSESYNLIFCNVPAPVYDHSLTREENFEVASNVKLFNHYLSEACSRLGLKTLDFYSISHGAEGFSGCEFHVDSYHLGPKALTKLEVLC